MKQGKEAIKAAIKQRSRKESEPAASKHRSSHEKAKANKQSNEAGEGGKSDLRTSKLRKRERKQTIKRLSLNPNPKQDRKR